MLMAKEGPLEKSTPDECRTALPLKLSAPEGSLTRDEWNTAGLHLGERTQSSRS